MATNKERIISHNTRLQNISTEIDTLPTEESLKNGSYLWNKYLVNEDGSINYKSVSYVISNDMNEYPQDGLLNGYYYKAFTVYPIGGYWNSSNVPSPSYFKNVAGNDTVALAFRKSQDYSDSKGSLYYSNDGITWNTTNIGSTYGCDGLEYHNGIWVATTTKGIYYSLQGGTWTQAKSFSEVYTNGCYIVGYVNNIWFTKYHGVGDGSSYYSEDGKTWTELNVSLDKVFYNNGIWVGTNTYDSATTIYYSYDGITWTTSMSSDTGVGNCISYNNNIWILYDSSASDTAYYSTDGINWVASNYNKGFKNVIYHNNIWVASAGGTDNGLHYSLDGMTWTQSNVTTGTYLSCCYLNGKFIAYSINDNTNVYYSEDGMTWTQTNLPVQRYNVYSYKNIFFASNYVSNSSKGIYYSEDGMTWTQSNLTSDYFYIFQCDNTLLATSRSSSGMYYSQDGKVWNPTNVNTGTFKYCWGFNNRWLACCQGGTIWCSIKEQLLS